MGLVRDIGAIGAILAFDQAYGLGVDFTGPGGANAGRKASPPVGKATSPETETRQLRRARERAEAKRTRA